MDKYTDFQIWVLRILEQIPEFNISIPDVVFNFLKDFIALLDCFIVYQDFSSLLGASVIFGFVELNFALFDYVRSFKN